uniref:Uncharacterized protein n=2 Tax=viral metagenome TaxID=1070528 RepID=A0A6H1ZA34_9ZZZZ
MMTDPKYPILCGTDIAAIHSYTSEWLALLDGYRELGARAAKAEEERDATRRQNDELATKLAEARAEVERLRELVPHRDEEESAAWARLVTAHRKAMDARDLAQRDAVELSDALLHPWRKRDDAPLAARLAQYRKATSPPKPAPPPEDATRS